MAIDTAHKRFSMMGVGFPMLKLIVPAGAIGADDRAVILDVYSGIALGTPVAAPEVYCEVVSLIDAGDEVLLCTIDVTDEVISSEMDAFIEVTCEMGGDEVILSEIDDSDVVIVSEIDC